MVWVRRPAVWVRRPAEEPVVARRSQLTHSAAMRETRDVHRRWRALRSTGTLVSLAAATAIAVVILPDRSEAADPGAEGEASRVSEVATPVELKLDSGDEQEIQASTLSAGQPVLLSLGLATSPPVSLAVRVLAADGRILETTGVVHEDEPTWARAEIEAGWLDRPGRYIVELKTNERTHFPLRRYAITVR